MTSRRNLAPEDMRFDALDERTDVPRQARLVGPNDFGLNSRIDIYLHDGDDGDGEGSYAERATLRFDDEMLERAAAAWPLPGPPIGDDASAHRQWRLECAERVLRAALERP